MAFSRKQDWIGVGRWCKGQGAHGRGGFILVGGQNLKEAFALEAVLKPFNVLSQVVMNYKNCQIVTWFHGIGDVSTDVTSSSSTYRTGHSSQRMKLERRVFNNGRTPG